MASSSARLGVLVVDDSQLTREAIRHVVSLVPELTVIAEASNGEEAIRLARRLRPALVTMDLNMPGIGGLAAIETIMRDRPAPVVVISERSNSHGVDLNYEALARGALELIPKASILSGNHTDAIRFAQHLKSIALGADAEPALPQSAGLPQLGPNQSVKLVAIGASTGGPKAVSKLLAGLPKDLRAPIVLVQHMAEDFFDSFLRFLSEASQRTVTPASDGMSLKPGHIVVAPPRQELFVKSDLTVRLSPSPAKALFAPSVDTLFFSAATALQRHVVGILMTGMGEDGAEGLRRLRRAGAITLVQERSSCAVFGMPKAALELGAAAFELTPSELVTSVKSLCAESVDRREHNVVILDDNPVTAGHTERVVRQHGHAVFTVHSLAALRSHLAECPVSLLVIDTEMRNFNPALLLRTLRRLGHAKTPLLVYADIDDTALSARKAELSAAGSVSKRRGDIAVAIEAVLSRTNSEALLSR
jgi:two-component system, chemotaxis family, protein-glutamate methylesterase/glutaminase